MCDAASSDRNSMTVGEDARCALTMATLLKFEVGNHKLTDVYHYFYVMDMCSLEMLVTVALSDLALLRPQDMVVCGCWHSLKSRSDMGGVHLRLFYHRSWWYKPHDFPVIRLIILKTYNLVFSLPKPETPSWQLIADTQKYRSWFWTSRSPQTICYCFLNIVHFVSWCLSPCYHSVFKHLQPGIKLISW